MPKYYRVNLKDKENNIIYPNIHNLISIDNETGAITSPGGFIGLATKASADSDGNKINTTYLKLSGGTMVGNIDMTNFAISFNNHQGGIRFKMANGSYEWGMYINNNNELRLGYSHISVVSNNNFYAQTDNTYNLGTNEKKWKSIYLSNAIFSSVSTSTHIKGNNGVAIINSTAAAGYNMLARQKSTNGVFTLGAWDSGYHLFYTEDSVISNNENKFTKNLKLLGEDGNSSFPGIVYATTFTGTLNGNANMTGNIDFLDGNNIGIYWKENGYGDKFKICPAFSGSGDSNLLKIQGAVGGANTDPSLYDLVTISGKSGNVTIKGNVQAKTFIGNLNGYASYPQGFGSKTGSQGWGNQDGTFVTGWSATGNSDIAFRANGGQLNVIIDGYYYCNEGSGRCTYSLDSSVRNMYANTIGTWNSNYSKYVNGTVMFCW